MKLRLGVTACLAVAVHLLFVSMGAWRVRPNALHATAELPSRIFEAYMGLTGAGNDFEFFAPSVASQLRARFFVTDRHGVTREDSFGTENREMSFRVLVMVAASARVPEATPLLTRSWAATILGRNPDAERVAVVREVYLVPTMAELRGGARPEWVELSRTEFERTAPQPTAALEAR